VVPLLVGRREWGMYERRKSADLDGRFCGLGRRRDSFKRRERAQFARACPAWPDRNRSGGKGRVNTIGSHQCRCTRIFDWGDQCRWTSHRQRLEPIHRRTCQWPWTQGLPQQQNVREGNIKKCDDLLHLATSLEISSTRTRGCPGGPSAPPVEEGQYRKVPDPGAARRRGARVRQPAGLGPGVALVHPVQAAPVIRSVPTK